MPAKDVYVESIASLRLNEAICCDIKAEYAVYVVVPEGDTSDNGPPDVLNNRLFASAISFRESKAFPNASSFDCNVSWFIPVTGCNIGVVVDTAEAGEGDNDDTYTKAAEEP